MRVVDHPTALFFFFFFFFSKTVAAKFKICVLHHFRPPNNKQQPCFEFVLVRCFVRVLVLGDLLQGVVMTEERKKENQGLEPQLLACLQSEVLRASFLSTKSTYRHAAALAQQVQLDRQQQEPQNPKDKTKSRTQADQDNQQPHEGQWGSRHLVLTFAKVRSQ